MKKFALIILLVSFLLYKWKWFVPKTWNEPKIGDISQLVKSYGPYRYPIESHQVYTEDGYILTVHRIRGRNEVPKPPVLLMHGLLLSSIDWVVLGPKKSIGLILADAGYDVWLGNNRGNTYSRNHKCLDPTLQKEQFYNYSYHEIGVYDLPAMIDYIVDYTGYNKITYIGFSQGVTSFFVMGSLRPKYNEKILLMNAWAPVTDAYNITNVFFKFWSLSPKVAAVTKLIGWYEMFDQKSEINSLIRLLCRIRPLCNFFLNLVGLSTNQLPLDQESKLVLLSNFPAGMSYKQISHYAQGTRTGRFTQFESEESYNLTKVTAPIILYYSDIDSCMNNDILLNSVAKALPNVLHIYKVPYTNFDHMDFLWGRDNKLLTKETLKNINLFNNKTLP